MDNQRQKMKSSGKPMMASNENYVPQSIPYPEDELSTEGAFIRVEEKMVMLDQKINQFLERLQAVSKPRAYQETQPDLHNKYTEGDQHRSPVYKRLSNNADFIDMMFYKLDHHLDNLDI